QGRLDARAQIPGLGRVAALAKGFVERGARLFGASHVHQRRGEIMPGRDPAEARRGLARDGERGVEAGRAVERGRALVKSPVRHDAQTTLLSTRRIERALEGGR